MFNGVIELGGLFFSLCRWIPKSHNNIKQLVTRAIQRSGRNLAQQGAVGDLTARKNAIKILVVRTEQTSVTNVTFDHSETRGISQERSIVFLE